MWPPSPSSRPGWRSLAATTIDFVVGLGASLILSSTLGMYFARRAVVMLHIGAPDTVWTGPIPLMLGVVGEVVYLLPCMLWLTWMLDPLTGASVGKRLLGLRVRAATGHTATPVQHWLRHTLRTAGLWGTTLGLVTGQWQVAVLAIVLGVVTLVPPIVDRLSGTRVMRHTASA